MVNFFYAGPEPLLRIVVVGTLVYLGLVVLLRASGKRTLAQMNSFDFVITVAIGATFGRVMTARSVPLVEALTALALLVLLQFLVTSLQIRSRRFAAVVTAQPTLLAYEGQVLHRALRKERLTESELHGALRKHGYASLDDVKAVVMESDGGLAVISLSAAGGSALTEVAGRDVEAG